MDIASLAPSSQLTDLGAVVCQGIHVGRQSRALLSELGVPLAYHEYEAGHALDAAMVRDFNDWLVAHIDADHAA